MSWFRRRNTFTKLMIGFSVMAFMVGCVGYLGVRALTQVNHLADRLYRNEALAVAHLRAANTQLVQKARITRNVILDSSFHNQEAVSKWVVAYEDFNAQFLKEYAAYKEAISPGGVASRTTEMENLFRKLETSERTIMTWAQSGKFKEANDNLTEARALASEVDHQIDAISNLQFDEMKNANAKVASVYENTRFVIVCASALAVVLAILIGLGISHLIARPLVALAGELAKVGIGQDKDSASAHVGDEVECVIASIREMVIRLRAIVGQAGDGKVSRVPQSADAIDFLGTLAYEIVQRKETEALLHKAKDVAENANRAKSEFLANMSHEIRTPMNGVLGMIELALSASPSAEQVEYLRTAQSSAYSLLAILNDILDFSKIEAGKLTLDPFDFRLRETLDATLKPLGMLAQDKGIELACRFSADVPDALRGDGARLGQILVNLIGNAIKFTEQGEVVVSVDLDPFEAREGTFLHFQVRDTGIGIPKDKQETIFEAFHQADSSTTRRYGGTGLGLAITSRLVEAMGGHIWLESVPGHGSTFHFSVRTEVQSLSRSLVYAKRPVNLRGMSVLIVDDNETNRLILEATLTQWEMRPTSVCGANEALAEMRLAARSGEPYQLLVLDVMMPGRDGLSLAAEVQKTPELAGAPIIILSSADRPGDRIACRDLGVAAYLTKPVAQTELMRAIQESLGTVLVDAKGRQLVTSPFENKPDGTVSISGALHILLAEDNIVNQRVARFTLQKEGHEVHVVANGREAVAAVAQDHFDLVLMDLQMPEMDGLAATAAIRAEEQRSGRHMPILALTAHAMIGDRERCLAAGMDGYVTKPIAAHELRQAIALAVGTKRPTMTANATDDSRAQGCDDCELPTLDRKALVELTSGDAASMRELSRLLEEASPPLLSELRSAIAQNDASVLTRAAHTLKGMLVSVTAVGAANKARRLEILTEQNALPEAEGALAELEEQCALVRTELAELAKESTRVELTEVSA